MGIMTLGPPGCATAPNCWRKFGQVVSSQMLLAVGFLIGGESLAYRLDSTWNSYPQQRTAAVPGCGHGVVLRCELLSAQYAVLG